MRYYNVYWSFAYIIIYCLFIIYILMSSFMIIFVDSYRRVSIQYGSPIQVITSQARNGSNPHEDHNHFKNWRSFLRWFFGWLPEDTLKKFGDPDEITGEKI
jgi:hypothetical protein